MMLVAAASASANASMRRSRTAVSTTATTRATDGLYSLCGGSGGSGNSGLMIGGSGGGHAVPEALLAALGGRFRETGAPRGITALHPVGVGDGGDRGLGHLAQTGLLKRNVAGSYVNSPPVGRMALRDEIEGLQLVDVRAPAETAEGTLPGARLIPLPALVGELGSLDLDAPTIVYCAGGYRSSIAASTMRAHGFRDVSDIIGGYAAAAR